MADWIFVGLLALLLLLNWRMDKKVQASIDELVETAKEVAAREE